MDIYLGVPILSLTEGAELLARHCSDALSSRRVQDGRQGANDHSRNRGPPYAPVRPPLLHATSAARCRHRGASRKLPGARPRRRNPLRWLVSDGCSAPPLPPLSEWVEMTA